jgi:hypothetical protein
MFLIFFVKCVPEKRLAVVKCLYVDITKKIEESVEVACLLRQETNLTTLGNC